MHILRNLNYIHSHFTQVKFQIAIFLFVTFRLENRTFVSWLTWLIMLFALYIVATNLLIYHPFSVTSTGSIKFCTHFKIFLVTYKTQNRLCPTCLFNSITFFLDKALFLFLFRESFFPLFFPRSNSSRMGERPLLVIAPRLKWNA